VIRHASKRYHRHLFKLLCEVVPLLLLVLLVILIIRSFSLLLLLVVSFLDEVLLGLTVHLNHELCEVQDKALGCLLKEFHRFFAFVNNQAHSVAIQCINFRHKFWQSRVLNDLFEVILQIKVSDIDAYVLM
jgi:hypothetical protein